MKKKKKKKMHVDAQHTHQVASARISNLPATAPSCYTLCSPPLPAMPEQRAESRDQLHKASAYPHASPACSCCSLPSMLCPSCQQQQQALSVRSLHKALTHARRQLQLLLCPRQVSCFQQAAGGVERNLKAVFGRDLQKNSAGYVKKGEVRTDVPISKLSLGEICSSAGGELFM